MRETEEGAREQLRALSDVLSVMSRAPNDVQPVLQAVIENAVRLCGATNGSIVLVEEPHLRIVASAGTFADPAAYHDYWRDRPVPIDRSSLAGRVLLDRASVQIEDSRADPQYQLTPVGTAEAVRTMLGVPLVRPDRILGVVILRRSEVAPFRPDQIRLVEAFSAQAVIAIENVRLFNETKEALERQTATAEVLKAMSQSVFDLPQVLGSVVESATRLSLADFGQIYRWQDDAYYLVAQHGRPPARGQFEKFRFVHPAAGGGKALLEMRTINLPDVLETPEFRSLDMNSDDERTFAERMRATGIRSSLSMPLIREGAIIGLLSLVRYEVRPFTDAQVQLVQTFADHAVIAIDNVRLFNETKEALERQTAISGILRVISGSPTDVEPVLKAISESAARFCGAEDAAVVLVRDGQLRVAAHYGPIPSFLERPRADLDWPVDRRSVTGRAVVDRRTIHVPDIQAESDTDYSVGKALTRELPDRTTLATPLLRDGRAVGALMLRRLEVRPFTDRQIELVETFADQAAIAIENVRLFNETKEALERQTAVSEILRVIAGSPTDVQPVLDAIADSAARFCGAENVDVILQREDGLLHPSAHVGLLGADVPPFPLSRETVTGRSMLEGRPVHVADLQTEDDEYPLGSEQARAMGHRTTLATPLMRGERAFGAILLRRAERRPFTEKQVNLVRTFADQAVIAIENVRLFNETKEALEQQTAISDVLASISGSVFDLTTVLRTIAERALALCRADQCNLYRVLDEDRIELLVRVGTAGVPGQIEEGHTLDRNSAALASRSTRTLATHHVADAREHPELPEHSVRARLAVPIVRDGTAVGTMLLGRFEAGAFSAREIQLVQTFAQQAGIAIENVRLFNETKEALDRQTAVSDILKVISSSPTDIQPVLDAIASSAARFTGAEDASVLLVRDDVAETRAHYGPISNPFSIALDRGSVTGAAVVDARLVHVTDVTEGDDYPVSKRLSLENDGQRTVLAAPLVREGTAIGAIVLRRKDTRGFSERQVELVKVFADQAVIAIENVRLFNETRESLERQTAISEVLGTISRSAFDLRAILDTVVQNAVRLCNARGGLIFRRDGDVYRFAAVHGSTPEFAKFFEDDHLPPITPGRGTLTGRVVVSKQPEHVLDLAADPEYAVFGEVNRMEGQRTSLGVPLLHQGEPIGAMSLWRNEVRAFSPAEIELVQTFADQAAIAIENVRLFNETKEALEQQRAIAEVLQTISRSVFDLQPVLDTVVENTARLASAEVALLSTSAGRDSYRVAAVYGVPVQDPDVAALWAGVQRHVARPADARSVMGRMLLGRQVIHIEDLETERELLEASVILRATGARTVLAVPMLREGRPIGGVIVARLAVRRFSDREIDLVQTFADQAAIAIQNTRLFSEIRDQSQQLELASRHKSEFLANMSHELRTPLNAIIGFSEVLLQGMFGGLNDKQREYQQDVLSSGRHLLSLINDILDLAKIEAGRVELELSEFSLPAALDNGVTMIRERAAKHGIRVQVDVAGVDRIVADERKVKQVVSNLLSNAVKFTPDGGRVGVRASREDGEIHVAVRDTGIGIDEADRERIFEEFQQASRDPERSREGTGLGLALTKRYVELHGGRIWVESEVGRGSTFTFALPLAPAGKEG